ncbi:putative major facilitator superfamily, MFS transporter superfamily [Helianthus annuus]|nr:putative major facilitator superfamily, MFS transporter superfamily [Helianthus annuus]KAJ0614121.1 putative major facilitator superfamily, MFS transporter superfamily [Helianthus annuus]KAJ0617775.1 putative major facilitator superfamily, MFS transporter superfamily [Helianthus annuus]KAJ0950709.1 putative major facilitator superfamily, MFS transporter superfamily [Helianthus annuus]
MVLNCLKYFHKCFLEQKLGVRLLHQRELKLLRWWCWRCDVGCDCSVRGWSQAFAGVVQTTLYNIDCLTHSGYDLQKFYAVWPTRPYADQLKCTSYFKDPYPVKFIQAFTLPFATTCTLSCFDLICKCHYCFHRQSSFLWGYMISPIAGGTLVDYYGGKIVMACGVALWSMATFLTPWATDHSLLALLTMCALLGVAEGVALPQTERSRAVGLAMAGFHLGSAIGLTLSPILMSQEGPFIIFGLSGFLWVLVWVSATSSIPERSPQITKYELEYIQSKRKKGQMKTAKIIPPFRRLLSKLPTWSLIVANSMHSWVLYFSPYVLAYAIKYHMGRLCNGTKRMISLRVRLTENLCS